MDLNSNSLNGIGCNCLSLARYNNHPSLCHNFSFMDTLQLLIIYMHHQQFSSLMIWHPDNYLSSSLRLRFYRRYNYIRAGQLLRGQLLTLSKITIVAILNNSLISLENTISNK